MRNRALFHLLTAVLVIVGCATWSGTESEYARWLVRHSMTPEDYVVSKFEQHDIVFVGEFHRVRHDALLIQNLIPRLYAAGVYNLGIELGASEYQDIADALVTADKYDEATARLLVFKANTFWGYQEYEDLYRAAWKVNHSRPKDARPFRIVHLLYRINWPALTVDNEKSGGRELAMAKGDYEEYMAKVILDEFVARREKALIYAGAHHSFTRYRQAIYDIQAKNVEGFINRTGNIVYSQIGSRAFNIYLHAPWYAADDFSHWIQPAGGAIERIMSEAGVTRIGFDVAGTKMSRLPTGQSWYAHGHNGLTLGDFCDGYIYQGKISEYESVTVDPLFITSDNIDEANQWTPNPRARHETVKQFVDSMRRDADMIKKRCGNLK